MFKAIKRQLFGRAIATYKRRKRKAFKGDASQALESAYRQIRRAKYAFLTTHGERSPDARLIEPIFEKSDFSFWIGTSPKSRKVIQIGQNSQVTLAISHQKDNSNLIIKANAELIDDVALRTKYWKPYWRLFFPAGPKGDDYILIKLKAEEIEVLDFSQSIVPEPFGLKPMRLVRANGNWKIAD